jgi:RNA polymerase sigma-70 factor (ECF subfamily)
MYPRSSAVDQEHDLTQLRLAITNDLGAGFVELVRMYGRTVYAVAFRLTHSSIEAEDLSSECFLRAFRALQNFPQERVLNLEPRAWLLTILLNTWRNGLRDESRRVAEVRMAEPPDRSDAGAGVEEQVLRREANVELRQMLSYLSPAQRAAVVLRHVAGLPIAEISSILGCREGTAKSHISRGMTALRRMYAEQLRGGEAVPRRSA